MDCTNSSLYTSIGIGFHLTNLQRFFPGYSSRITSNWHHTSAASNTSSDIHFHAAALEYIRLQPMVYADTPLTVLFNNDLLGPFPTTMQLLLITVMPFPLPRWGKAL